MMRVYRLLAALLLPPSFRRDYGAEIEGSVGARLSEARGWTRALVVSTELVDLLRTSIREWSWEMGWTGGGRESTRGERRRPDGWHAERNRRVRGDALAQDVRYALRQIRRAPGFSAVVVLTLATGIGLNTAVFSSVHALLLRPLSGVADPDRLVQVYRSFPGSGYGANSIPHYRDLRDRGRDVFDGVAAWSFVTLSLGGDVAKGVVVGQMVSANFFDVLGVQAVLGRTFLPEEAEGLGTHPVVVLSHDAWRGRFAGDPEILDRTVMINGLPFDVVGVAPEGFRGAMDLYSPTLWAPLVMQPRLQPLRGDRPDNRNSNFTSVIARMKPSATVETTRAGAQALLDGLRRDHPDVYEGTGIRLVPQNEAGIGPSYGRTPADFAALLMSVVGLLLLLACANVANMFLSRAEERRREIAIRIGLGAARGRIVRQLVTESLLVATLAGLGGLALAALALPLLERVRPPSNLPISVDLALSIPVLSFTLLVSMGTAVLFGLLPALQATRARSVGGLGGTAARAVRSSSISPALVVLQTGLAAVLLLGAATFLRSLTTATRIDPGFQAGHLLTARVDPGLLGYDRATSEAVVRGLAERMEAEPGVTGVSWTDAVPLGLAQQATRILVPGYEPGPNHERLVVDYARVGPGYFETMGIPVERGREIVATDDASSPGVVVVNQAMADRFWPGEDALGRIVGAQGGERVVVGIAATGKYRSLQEEAAPFMYIAMAQDFRSDVTVVVRSATDPASLAPVLRRRVAEIDPAMPVRDVRTMEDALGVNLFPSRVATSALALFGAIGLLLSTLGIHGVLAHAVSRQRREIGIRLALGARPNGVLGTILARGARLTGMGLVLGVVAAVLASEALRGLLFTDPLDALTLVGVPALLGVVAMIATCVPARAAARVDPIRAIKAE
jgi:predicted permease